MNLFKIILSIVGVLVLVYTISYMAWQWKTNKFAGGFVLFLSIILTCMLILILFTF